MKPIKCLLTILAACASLGLASQANALVIGDAHELGFVNFGIPSGDQDRENYVNHLIGMALGSTDTALGQDFTRSNNNFGPLADAEFNSNGTSLNIDVTGFDYLFAKYDGPNYGSEVWYSWRSVGSHYNPRKRWKVWPFRLDALHWLWRQRSRCWRHRLPARRGSDGFGAFTGQTSKSLI